jgi:hypothetical protein
MKLCFASPWIFCLAICVSCGMKDGPPGAPSDSESRARPGTAPDSPGDPPNESKGGLEEERHAYLELLLHNGTDGDIDFAELDLGGHCCTFGFIGTRVSKGYLGWTLPVGTNAVVRWRDSGGTKREAEVGYAAIYDPDVPGSLNFTIVSNEVMVTFEKVSRKQKAGP